MAGIKPAATPIGAEAFLIAMLMLALLLHFLSSKLFDAGFRCDDWLALAAWVCSPAYDPRSEVARNDQAKDADHKSSHFSVAIALTFIAGMTSLEN